MDDDLMEAHEARIQALVAGDLKTLDRHVADDLTYTSPHGKVMTKSEVFESFRSGDMTVQRMEVSDLRARVFGDTAVMTYKAATTFNDRDVTVDGTVQSTAVYVRRDGTWKLAAAHQTSITADGD